MVALPEHVHAVTAKGKTYFYYHPGRGTKNTGKRVRLPNDPRDPAFWEMYARLGGNMQAEVKPAPFTFEALIAGYRASPEFAKRKPRTRVEYERHMATISGVWGPRLVKGVRAKHVLQLRDSFASTPTKADHLVSMLSTLISWGIPRDYAEINPCREVPNLASSDGFAPWEWEDIIYASSHLKRYLWWAAALALYTGQRQSDVLSMKRDTLARGEIGVRQDKTDKLLWIPVHAELEPIIREIPRNSVFLLTNSRGRPWGTGFKASWQKEMSGDVFERFRERRLVFHGLRKSAVVMLLESGCTDAEVAAITGQSRDMVEHYSIMVNQRKLARAAILKWEAANRK
jgi:integrase